MKTNYPKGTLWISIDPSEMMRESMRDFLEHLKKFDVEYTAYTVTPNRLYLELALPNAIAMDGNHEFHRMLGEYIYYHPINILKNKPNVSDYDTVRL